jgi:hypothetical protein
MSDQNPAGDQRDEATTQIDEMRAAVADEVAALLSRLPDTDDLATLAAAINDPEALARLLAARDSKEDQSE